MATAEFVVPKSMPTPMPFKCRSSSSSSVICSVLSVAESLVVSAILDKDALVVNLDNVVIDVIIDDGDDVSCRR